MKTMTKQQQPQYNYDDVDNNNGSSVSYEHNDADINKNTVLIFVSDYYLLWMSLRKVLLYSYKYQQ